MSTISEKLTQLNTIKGDIKTAINNKGGEVGDDFSTYATAINNLSTGSGGSGEIYMHPEFFELRTSHGVRYDSLFRDNSIPGDLDLSDWDTSGVISLANLFNYSYSLISINLSGWDVSKVDYFTGVFSSCSKTTSINLSGWNTSRAKGFNNMFYNCNKLVTIIGYLDLSNLTNGFYPALYSSPIYNCKSLETLYLKNIYKDITVTNASKYSINLGETKIKDECLIYIINELPDLINDKGLTATDKIVLTLPPINTLTAEQVQPAIDKGWQVANVNY